MIALKSHRCRQTCNEAEMVKGWPLREKEKFMVQGVGRMETVG